MAWQNSTALAIWRASFLAARSRSRPREMTRSRRVSPSTYSRTMRKCFCRGDRPSQLRSSRGPRGAPCQCPSPNRPRRKWPTHRINLKTLHLTNIRVVQQHADARLPHRPNLRPPVPLVGLLQNRLSTVFLLLEHRPPPRFDTASADRVWRCGDAEGSGESGDNLDRDLRPGSRISSPSCRSSTQGGESWWDSPCFPLRC